MKYAPTAVILTVLEAFLIGLCCEFRSPCFRCYIGAYCSSVLYAVWKSSLYPVAQGRLSIALSVTPNPESGPSPAHGTPEDENIRRGWWDYVPQAPAPLAQPSTPASSICRVRTSLRKPFSPIASAAPRDFGEKSPHRSAMHKLEGDTYGSVQGNIGPLEGSPLPASTNNARPTKQKERQPYEDTSKDLGMVQMRAVIMSEVWTLIEYTQLFLILIHAQLISAGCITASNVATAVITALGAQDGKLEFGTSMRLGAICKSLIQTSGTAADILSFQGHSIHFSLCDRSPPSSGDMKKMRSFSNITRQLRWYLGQDGDVTQLPHSSHMEVSVHPPER